MQLGMFFTGVSPAGGASNIWTAILDGNIDLSVTMTSISTFAAFIMMPLWVFTLGEQIFTEGDMAVPYSQISTYAVGLVLPLLIGYLLQRYQKKVANVLARTLKMFATFIILFIICFAVVTNLYLFELFSWQVFIAACARMRGTSFMILLDCGCWDGAAVARLHHRLDGRQASRPKRGGLSCHSRRNRNTKHGHRDIFATIQLAATRSRSHHKYSQ